MDEFRVCAICVESPSEAVHEITGGMSTRRLSVDEPATWLPLCNYCHEQVHAEPAYWSKARQMAVKLVTDPSRFDLQTVNKILSGKEDASPVILADVAEFLTLSTW